jgi:hypothetical protein
MTGITTAGYSEPWLLWMVAVPQKAVGFDVPFIPPRYL